MTNPSTIADAKLFEADETAWLEGTAQILAEGRYDALDHGNLVSYLLDMAISDKREVFNRLVLLISHLLKWEHQPEKRSRSWSVTILQQRQELLEALESKSLLNHARERLPKAYSSALKRAVVETGLPIEAFPAECPFTLEAILTDE